MAGSGSVQVMLGLCTAVLLAWAFQWAQPVLAPIVFALFIIALAWPLQHHAERLVPAGLALILTVVAVLVVLVGMSLTAAWGFGRVARWVIANAAQIQALFAGKAEWLEARGFPMGSAFAEQFDTRQLVRLGQAVLGQVQGILTFLLLTLLYALIGLLEVVPAARQLRRIGQARPAALGVLAGLELASAKLRSYMMVRTLMSVVTGIAVTLFAFAMGLQLAPEWGVIAFVLNYIPVIGPLVATLLPTVFAGLQFGTVQVALLVFLGLQVVQNTIGSYVEPRVAGARLALSPFMVLVAVFLGTFLWGVPGAFIGVPVLITILSLCAQFEHGRWIADLLSGRSDPIAEGRQRPEA
jgi:predicted PurR-regulated permease PerM